MKSDVINILRFPLMILVVIIHTNFNIEYNTDGTFYNHFFRWFQYVMYSAVPTFYMISGYLFFRKKDFNGSVYKSSVRKRIRSLAIPYIVWNTIFIAIYYVGGIIRPDLCGNFVKPIGEMSFIDILRCYWNVHDHTFHAVPIDGPLYYVFYVFLSCVLSPVIYFAVRIFRRYSILLFLLFLYLPLHYDFSTAFFFFSIGSYIALLDIDICKLPSKYVILCLISFLITCTVIELMQLEQIFLTFTCYLLCIMSTFGIATHISSKYNPHVPNILIRSLFFVYAYHLVVTRGLTKLAMHIFPYDSSIALFACQIIILVTYFTVGITLYAILPKPIKLILTGNR